MKRITIAAAGVRLTAALNDSPTAQSIWDALPLSAQVNTWGDEIYFAIPVQVEPAEDAREDVEVGELGYWPVGQAFCIFFGPTPASDGTKPRAASPVNVFGRMEGDAALLRSVRSGARIALERIE